MSSESRTFIELSDITGMEFECPKCEAKILYPIKKHYEPLPENCPSCGAAWFDENPARSADQPQIVEVVQKTLISLHNISETPAIRTRVRLNIKGLSEENNAEANRRPEQSKPEDSRSQIPRAS
jgi:hypothetical protein